MVVSGRQEMGFPAFYADLEESLSRRLFRVPEMYLDQFAGDEVERAFTSAGLTGLHFVRADSSRRRAT